MMTWDTIDAKVVRGQQLASGTSERDPTFNKEIIRDGVSGKGTIFLQSSVFKQHGLDLGAYFGDTGYFNGTINLLLEPHRWTLGPSSDFEYFLRGVRWTDKLDIPGQEPLTENFFLSPCQVAFKTNLYKGMIYIPDQTTKPKQHMPRLPYIDVIAPWIAELCYGSHVTLFFNPRALRVSRCT